MSTRQKLALAGVGLFIVGAIWNYVEHRAKVHKTVVHSNEGSIASASEKPLAQQAPVAETTKSRGVVVGAEELSKTLAEAKVKSKSSALGDSESTHMQSLQKALLEYTTILRKPFPTQDEQKLLQESLSNVSLIEGSKTILMAIPARVENSDVTNHLNASRFLINALDGADGQLALRSIQDVLRDPAVENKNQEASVRKFIAGDRAELMYGLLQHNPDSIVEIKAALAGDISAKILDNVQKHQKVLVAEVDSEVTKLAATFKK